MNKKSFWKKVENLQFRKPKTALQKTPECFDSKWVKQRTLHSDSSFWVKLLKLMSKVHPNLVPRALASEPRKGPGYEVEYILTQKNLKLCSEKWVNLLINLSNFPQYFESLWIGALFYSLYIYSLFYSILWSCLIHFHALNLKLFLRIFSYAFLEMYFITLYMYVLVVVWL
jgi:hypothetical protein